MEALRYEGTTCFFTVQALCGFMKTLEGKGTEITTYQAPTWVKLSQPPASHIQYHLISPQTLRDVQEMMTLTSNLSLWEMEAGRSKTQGSLGYMRH